MARSESESSSSQDNRDMLSSLPDPVLHHIMSFMPAMQAVQLCVLSKRWKTLWTTLPVLNFGFCELGDNQLNHSTLNRVERLAEFVSMVLLLRETTSQLHTFTLDFGSEYSEYVRIGDVLRMSIRPWIRYAIKCDLRVLAINWMDEKILFLPSDVFTCPSLEYVTLRAIGTPKAWWEAEIANCRTFSKLTYLSVGSCMNFHQFNLFSSLLEHCPRLKKLSLGPGFEFRGEQIDDKVPRFKCEQLETVEVKFYLWDTNFHWVVKCLQEAVTELPNCRIIMTSLH